MTFDEFKADFCAFLKSSTVNLGRKTTKTRQAFLDEAEARFDTFGDNFITAETCDSEVETKEKTPPPTSPMSKSVMCIKPPDRDKALDVGKGVHAMTPTESQRADEQLNRSPFGSKTVKKE